MNEMTKKRFFYKYAESAYNYLVECKEDNENKLEVFKEIDEKEQKYWTTEIAETEASIEAINDLLKRIEKF